MKLNLQPKPAHGYLAKLLAIALLLSVSTQPAAGIMISLSVEELTRTSDSIVIGRVLSLGKILSPDIPVRYATIEVERYLKNDLGLATLEVSVLGGSLDNITVWVEDQPSFEAGERVLLFLSERGGVFYVNGLFQGKYRLEEGRAINQDSSRNTSEEEILLKIQASLRGVEKPKFLKDFYGGLGRFKAGIYVVATDEDPLLLTMAEKFGPAGFWGFIANHTTSRATEREFISLLVSRGEFRTGGYDIQLVSLQLVESYPSTIKMVVNFTDPGEGVAVTQAFTNPLVLIPVGKLTSGEYKVRMDISRFILSYVQGVLVFTPVKTLLPEIWNASFAITEETGGVEGTLSIQTTDPFGRNAGPAEIEIQGSSARSSLITNNDGRLTTKLPAGHYEVRAHYRDLEGVAAVNVSPSSEQSITIRLLPVQTPQPPSRLLVLATLLAAIGAAAAIIAVILFARHSSPTRPLKEVHEPPIQQIDQPRTP